VVLFEERPSAVKQFAEKLEIQQPAPKGAVDFEGLAVSLKRYPDTNPSFSADCKAPPFQNRFKLSH
jgi:hypothetical protein